MREEAEQTCLFRWAAYESCKIPELALLFHIPNGGLRSKSEAARFKAAGVKAGIPDIFLPVSRGDRHGLFIELKAENGKPTKKQKEWLEKLNKQGYESAVCTGFEAAQKKILSYLGIADD